MGCYTAYTLRAPGNLEMEAGIIEAFRADCEDAAYALNENGNPKEYSKWYEHEEDMKKLSRKYPDVLLLLEGSGEGPCDRWKKYFLGGKVQVCLPSITFEPFDMNKLEG